jgi:hypothetical protein
VFAEKSIRDLTGPQERANMERSSNVFGSGRRERSSPLFILIVRK